MSECISTEENLSDGELSEDADFQEAYNKLCKVNAKDAMNVELGHPSWGDNVCFLFPLFENVSSFANLSEKWVMVNTKIKKSTESA